MSPGLALLFARRLATPGALTVVALTAYLPADARSGWWFSILAVALIAQVRAAGFPQAWLTGEGDWLGTAARSRSSLLGTAWTGATLGTLCLVGAATLGVALGARRGAAPASVEATVEASVAANRGTGVLMEASAVGGPKRSLVLLPGESFELPLASDGPAGREVRVRTTNTLGAASPTTYARVEAGSSAARVSVARRTWLTLGLGPDASEVRVTNVGTGALAILGPLPVEVWAPSSALLDGHLRMAGHAASLLVALVSVALLLGVVLGPGVAALFAGSLWLGVWMWMTRQGPSAMDVAASWMPGGPGLGRALDAVREGRSPLPVASATLTSAGAVLAGSWLLGTQLLRTWRDEVRG